MRKEVPRPSSHKGDSYHSQPPFVLPDPRKECEQAKDDEGPTEKIFHLFIRGKFGEDTIYLRGCIRHGIEQRTVGPWSSRLEVER